MSALLWPAARVLLAQADPAAPGGAAAGEPSPLAFLGGIMPLVLIPFLAYVMFFLPQRAKDRQYRDLVKNLKEKDHVVTSGGIYGVVTNVQRDQQRVTLRIDESTGAKLRVAMWAIAQVLKDEPRGEAPSGPTGA